MDKGDTVINEVPLTVCVYVHVYVIYSSCCGDSVAYADKNKKKPNAPHKAHVLKSYLYLYVYVCMCVWVC